MFDALYIGATGMHAQQVNLDTIANNLANVNTTGYKKGRVGFADLVTRGAARVSMAGLDTAEGLLAPGVRLGAGVGIGQLSKLFDAGDLKKTDSSLDVAIQGDGFLEVLMPDGSSAFTRGGTLKVNGDGLLATQTGYAFKPGIRVPEDTQSLIVQANGEVLARVAGRSEPAELGQLELVRFVSPQGLLAQGENLYRSSETSGDPISGKAGEDGLGALAQGYLEGSNVKLVEEMVNMMVAQRSYEASVKVVQAADEMLGMVNGLRR